MTGQLIFDMIFGPGGFITTHITDQAAALQFFCWYLLFTAVVTGFAVQVARR